MPNKKIRMSTNASILEQIQIHALLQRNKKLSRRYLTLFSSLFYLISPLTAYQAMLAVGSQASPEFKTLVEDEMDNLYSILNQTITDCFCYFNTMDSFSLSFQNTTVNGAAWKHFFRIEYDRSINGHKSDQFAYWSMWDERGALTHKIEFAQAFSHQRFIKAKGLELFEKLYKVTSFPFIALRLLPTACTIRAQEETVFLSILTLLGFCKGLLIFSILSKCYFSPYLVNRLYEKFYKRRSSNELIDKTRLEQENLALFFTSRLHLQISFLCYLLAGTWIYYQPLSLEFIIVAYSISFSALIDLLDCFETASPYNAMIHKKNILSQALSKYSNIQCDLVPLTASHTKTMADFFIRVESMGYRGIPPFTMDHILKKAFANASLDIFAQDKGIIILAGDCSLSKKQAAHIEEITEKNWKRLKDIKHLKEQLLKLDMHINQENKLIIRMLNKPLGEEEVQTILLVPEIYKGIFSQEKLITIFKPSYIHLHCLEGDEETDVGNFLRIILNVHKINHEESLSKLFEEIRQFKHELVLNKPIALLSEKKERRGSTGSRRGSFSEEKGTARRLSFSLTQPERIVLRWPSASYDSASNNPEVSPVQSRYLVSNTFFTFFALTKEDFNNDELQYKQFKNKTMRAKMAMKRKAEGIKFINEEEGMKIQESITHDYSFFPSVKIKVLGLNGYNRAYGYQEQSSTGEVLLVFKKLARAH